MEFNLNTINRDTVACKLLFAAVIELTTRHWTKTTPDEAIKSLWEIHKNTEEANGRKDSCVSSSPTSLPFSKAVNISIQKDQQNQNAKLEELNNSSNTILLFATPSMNPEDYCSLESLLVKLYRHHLKS